MADYEKVIKVIENLRNEARDSLNLKSPALSSMIPTVSSSYFEMLRNQLPPEAQDLEPLIKILVDTVFYSSAGAVIILANITNKSFGNLKRTMVN